MATKRQIEANRRNARRSTGPRTEAGKDASKRNAARHGLSGAGAVLPEEMVEAINARYVDWYAALRPYHEIDEFFVKNIATESVIFENSQRFLVVQWGCR